jgi:hypothetical protein
MAKTAVVQTNFNAGELSPLMYGRVDFPKYKNALAVCLNHVPLIQGSLLRRPGTRFVAEIKQSASPVNLYRFAFSTQPAQCYILEIGAFYIRFYKLHGQILNGSVPVEIVTPYALADIFNLQFTQSADTLYIAHPNYQPASLGRSSDTAWVYTPLLGQMLDGPYLNLNPTPTTISFSATVGFATCTASSNTGINGGAGFQATDVGRVIRMQGAGPLWGWGRISAWINSATVTVAIGSAMASTGASAAWRLGVWSDTTGYPGCVRFFEDRLVWSGSNSAPTTIYGSVTSDYLNHQPTSPAGVVADSNAYSFTLNSDDVQTVRWMMSDEKGLLAGTNAGEWLVRPSTQGVALTPTNVNAKQTTSYGSANINAIHIGKATIFIQKSLRKVRELTYDFITDGFKGPNMTVLSEHVTKGGMLDWAYQQEPHSIVWSIRADGTLLGFSYDREQEVNAWHRHILGGVSNASGSPAVVESVACIPEPGGSYDEVWLVVRRWINGASHRYIEYLTKYWEAGDTPNLAAYVDCSAQYNGAPATVISGLGYLVGETVEILADGAVVPSQIVSGAGTITLTHPASIVQVGYAYNSDGQDLRDDAGAADGTSQGKFQRANRISFRLVDAGSMLTGADFSHLTPVAEMGRRDFNLLGAAIPLFNGDVSFTWDGDYSLNQQSCWRFNQPFPATVLLITNQEMTFDR